MLSFLARELHSWRVMHFSSNKLVRPGDRVETVVLLMLTVAATYSLSFSLLVGSNTYSSMKQTVEQEQQTRHQVSATVLETPHSVNDDVDATWPLPDGRIVTESIESSPTDKAGQQRTIWIDAGGSATEKPRTMEAAVTQAIAAGLTTAFGIILGWGLAVAAIRRTADRHRLKAWDAEWKIRSIDTNR